MAAALNGTPLARPVNIALHWAGLEKVLDTTATAAWASQLVGRGRTRAAPPFCPFPQPVLVHMEGPYRGQRVSVQDDGPALLQARLLGAAVRDGRAGPSGMIMREACQNRTSRSVGNDHA